MSMTRDEWDETLGRWRWSEGENLVVYPLGEGRVRVLDERTGVTWQVLKEEVDIDSGVPQLFRAAARDYFKAHEPKPWLEAKPGELWEVTVGPGLMTANIPAAEQLPMQVMFDDTHNPGERFFVHWNGPDAETVDVENRHITAGRRLWPEVADA